LPVLDRKAAVPLDQHVGALDLWRESETARDRRSSTLVRPGPASTTLRTGS